MSKTISPVLRKVLQRETEHHNKLLSHNHYVVSVNGGENNHERKRGTKMNIS